MCLAGSEFLYCRSEQAVSVSELAPQMYQAGGWGTDMEAPSHDPERLTVVYAQ